VHLLAAGDAPACWRGTVAAVAGVLAGTGLQAREEPLTLERLGAADGVVLTSSVRLATPATLPGARPSARGAEVAALLRDGLR